jgi:hypothetical protein
MIGWGSNVGRAGLFVSHVVHLYPLHDYNKFVPYYSGLLWDPRSILEKPWAWNRARKNRTTQHNARRKGTAKYVMLPSRGYRPLKLIQTANWYDHVHSHQWVISHPFVTLFGPDRLKRYPSMQFFQSWRTLQLLNAVYSTETPLPRTLFRSKCNILEPEVLFCVSNNKVSTQLLMAKASVSCNKSVKNMTTCWYYWQTCCKLTLAIL